jgi:membrane-bound lytic murein transglycosylase C
MKEDDMSNRLSKSLTVLMILTLIPLSTIAQDQSENAQSEFDAWRQEQERAETDYINTLEAEYRAWVLADSIAFATYKQEIEGKWGSVTPTTKKDWVEYAEDKESLSAVDFEKGEAVVAILVEENAGESGEVSLARLEDAIRNLVVEQGKTMDYSVNDQTAQPLRDRPVLENQLATSSGRAVTAENSEQFAKDVVTENPVKRTAVKGKDGISRVKLEVVIPLVPKHLRVRAKRFVEPVKEYADEYELDARIVFALIHTESYFNPKATSHIPAFGLMQLVPRFGAKDAYKAVYSKDRLLPPNYLYKPQQNLELGCAYLHLVLTRYLKKVKDPLSRLYCAIAAYNTGAGNVSKAFTGNRNIGVAARTINTMTPEEVLARLKKDLPYQETKDYIVRILERAKFYEEWKN